MTGLNLDDFGPWRDGICEGCDTLHLVTGPPEGPQRCKPCWMGEPVPRRRRKPDPDAVSMFDTGPYDQRRGGA